MPTYRVTLSEMVFYELEVECEDDQQVVDAAFAKFKAGEYKAYDQANLTVEDWELTDD